MPIPNKFAYIRPPRILRGQQAEQAVVFALGHEAPPVEVAARPMTMPVPPSVAGVLDGVGLDGRPSVGVPHLYLSGPAVDLGLELLAVIGVPGAGVVLYTPAEYLLMMPPLAPTKPNDSGRGAGAPHGFRDGVHRVVVARAAEERQPAGEREPARVVGGDAEPVADVEHRRGRARGTRSMVARSSAVMPAGAREHSWRP